MEPCRRRVDYDAFGLEDPTVAALEESRMEMLRAQWAEMDLEEAKMAELRARLAEMEFLSDAERYAFALAEAEDAPARSLVLLARTARPMNQTATSIATAQQTQTI